MGDNIPIRDANAVGVQVAADDIAGVQHQRVKVEWGDDGVANDVSEATPMPVSVAGVPLPTGAATAARQDLVLALLGEIRDNTAVDGSGTAVLDGGAP